MHYQYVQAVLDLYTSAVEIPDYDCNTCASHQSGEKKDYICAVADYLVFTLKRFVMATI